ncbi:MAG: hypothetical protein PHD01_00510 [Geobacteraceae bacterium]|nr:hypothetical protein [Geobacteraceae bacterium]
MKQLLCSMMLLYLLVPSQTQAGCSDMENSGFDSYRYALHGVRESSLAKVREYAKKSELAAESAQNSADECSCHEAEVEFYKAFRSARDAMKAETLETSKGHLQQVLRAAKAGTEAAENCR